MTSRAAPVVTTDWLADNLGRVKLVDATWFMPGQGDPAAAYAKAHIPGAVRFDIDAIADRASPLPHMLPRPEAFAAAVGALGIGDQDHVVAYGFAGPRAWWMFRVMGHDAVSVLDGGLAKWTAEGRAVEAGEPPAPAPANFTPRFRPELVADFDQVGAALAAGVPVLDARPGERFRGEAPEPRPGLKGGHMPGALSLPSGQVFRPDHTVPPAAAVEAAARAAGYDPARPAIATCGSGVSACMIALGLAQLGQWDVAVYDGSWTEWGGRADAAVATGP